jgi:hypothetical protein
MIRNSFLLLAIILGAAPIVNNGLATNKSVTNKENNTVATNNFESKNNYIRCSELYAERLDTLHRTVYWRKLMNTSKDTFVFYASPEKKILCEMATDVWNNYTELEKENAKFNMRLANGYASDKRIMYGMGRNHFYDVQGVMPDINKSIKIFNEQATDPFYAQAILLIESPGKLAKSHVGAYGPFQLMKSVGLNYGLKINNQLDERADLRKSAIAACKLINQICIPYTNNMLKKYNIAWCEDDLWYRLMVLHVYHAGAGNVAKALNVIQPQVGSMALIKKLWETNAGGFQNASQNYSQVAIASLLELDKIIDKMPQNMAVN